MCQWSPCLRIFTTLSPESFWEEFLFRADDEFVEFEPWLPVYIQTFIFGKSPEGFSYVKYSPPSFV